MVKKLYRKRAAELLDGHHQDDAWRRFVDLCLITLILLNVAAVILVSIPALEARFYTWFRAFEVFSIAVFTLEYLFRVWSCIELPDPRYQHPVTGRLRYILTPLALIDLAAILPFYLVLLFPVDLRFLRTARLLRVLKFARYTRAMEALWNALRAEADSLMAAFFLLLVLFVVASSGIYLLEHEGQPDAFGSIPAAMWWAMATLTTVGYGDVVPVTVWGRVFGGCITVVGVGMVALPAGIIASGFDDQLHRRRADINGLIQVVCSPGSTQAEKQAALQQLERNWGLSSENIRRLQALDLNQPVSGHARPDDAEPPPGVRH